MAYAHFNAEVEHRPNGKSSIRQQLEQVEKTTGVPHEKLLNAPELPEEYQHVWSWFCELFSGEVPSYQEMQAWSQLTGNIVLPREFNLIRRLARKFLEVENGRHSNATG